MRMPGGEYRNTPRKIKEILVLSMFLPLPEILQINIIKKGEYRPMFSVDMMIKDFDLAFDIAKHYKASLPVTAMVRQFYEEESSAGKGSDDYAVLVQRLERNLGIER